MPNSDPTFLMQRVGRDAFIQGEFNDCAVRAVTILSGYPYKRVHQAFAEAGREACDGVYPVQFREALSRLGLRLVRLGPRHDNRKGPPPAWAASILARYPRRHRNLRGLTTYHPRRFPAAWADMPPLLLETGSQHVAAFVAGEVHDWTRDHHCWIMQAYRLAAATPTR